MKGGGGLRSKLMQTAPEFGTPIISINCVACFISGKQCSTSYFYQSWPESATNCHIRQDIVDQIIPLIPFRVIGFRLN
jgi:hypothetical protein